MILWGKTCRWESISGGERMRNELGLSSNEVCGAEYFIRWYSINWWWHSSPIVETEQNFCVHLTNHRNSFWNILILLDFILRAILILSSCFYLHGAEFFVRNRSCTQHTQSMRETLEVALSVHKRPVLTLVLSQFNTFVVWYRVMWISVVWVICSQIFWTNFNSLICALIQHTHTHTHTHTHIQNGTNKCTQVYLSYFFGFLSVQYLNYISVFQLIALN